MPARVASGQVDLLSEKIKHHGSTRRERNERNNDVSPDDTVHASRVARAIVTPLYIDRPGECPRLCRSASTAVTTWPCTAPWTPGTLLVILGIERVDRRDHPASTAALRVSGEPEGPAAVSCTDRGECCIEVGLVGKSERVLACWEPVLTEDS